MSETKFLLALVSPDELTVYRWSTQNVDVPDYSVDPSELTVPFTLGAELGGDVLAFLSEKTFERRILNYPQIQAKTLSNALSGVTGFQAVDIEFSNVVTNYDGTTTYLFDEDTTLEGYTAIGVSFDEDAGIVDINGKVTLHNHGLRSMIHIEDTSNDIFNTPIGQRDGTALFTNSQKPGSDIEIYVGRNKRIGPLVNVAFTDATRTYRWRVGYGTGYGGEHFKEVTTLYNGDKVFPDIEGIVRFSWNLGFMPEIADNQQNGFYDYWWVTITHGDGTQEVRYISSYTSAEATVNAAWDTIPEVGVATYRMKQWRFYDGSQVSPFSGYAIIELKTRLGDRDRLPELYADVDGFQAIRNRVIGIKALLSLSRTTSWGLGLTVDDNDFFAAASTNEINDTLMEGQLHGRPAIDILSELCRGQRDIIIQRLRGTLGVRIDGPKAVDSWWTLSAGQYNRFTSLGEIERVDLKDRIKTLPVAYRYSQKTDTYLHTINRDANALGIDAEPMELRTVYDHTSADRLGHYQSWRLKSFSEQITATAGLDAEDLRFGYLIHIYEPARGIDSDWEIISIDKHQSNYTLRLMRYYNDTYTYSASPSLPTNEDFPIQPDYENTPPLGITSLNLKANRIVITSDKRIMALVRFSWTPPEDNYGDTVISIREEGDVDFDQIAVATNSYQRYLVPGKEYDFLFEPRNAARTLKGTGTSYNLTAVSDTDSPAVPLITTSIGKFQTVTWYWRKVTTNANGAATEDIEGYEYEIYTAATGGTKIFPDETAPAFTPNLTATHTINTPLTTTVIRYLWVRARDYSGNVSAWSNRISGQYSPVRKDDIPDSELSDGSFQGETTNRPVTSSESTITSLPTYTSVGGSLSVGATGTLSITTNGANTAWQCVLRLKRGTTTERIATIAIPITITGISTTVVPFSLTYLYPTTTPGTGYAFSLTAIIADRTNMTASVITQAQIQYQVQKK